MAQETTKLKYNSKAAVGAIENPKDIFTQGYHKIKEFRYILKTDTKTVTELVVGIKTLLDIISIALQDERKKE